MPPSAHAKHSRLSTMTKQHLKISFYYEIQNTTSNEMIPSQTKALPRSSSKKSHAIIRPTVRFPNLKLGRGPPSLKLPNSVRTEDWPLRLWKGPKNTLLWTGIRNWLTNFILPLKYIHSSIWPAVSIRQRASSIQISFVLQRAPRFEKFLRSVIYVKMGKLSFSLLLWIVLQSY